MEDYHLNVAVARLMELVSATRKAIDSGPGAADPAVREAAEALAVMLSLFAPYTAEECWEALGGPGAGAGRDPVSGQGRLAGRGPGSPGSGDCHLRGAGERQGPRPAGSLSGDQRRMSCATWRWPRKAWRARWPDWRSSG